MRGDYLISATADGYRDAGQKLELSQATESKNITVPMVSATDLTKANIAIKFKDNQGNDGKRNGNGRFLCRRISTPFRPLQSC